MSTRKRVVADLLFGIQALSALIFGGSQFVRMLTSTQGVSITWFGFWEAFLGLNLWMAFRAHKNQPSRVTRQTLGSYSIWTSMVTADFIVALTKSSWDANDTNTTILVVVGGVITFLVARSKGLAIGDPMVKAWLAVFFKFVPQILLAYKVYQVGGAGLAPLMVWNGHVTILMRIGQLAFSIREAGWDRNRIGSAISEVANELSWVIVTIVWLTR